MLPPQLVPSALERVVDPAAHVVGQILPPVARGVLEISRGLLEAPPRATSGLGRGEEGDARADQGAEKQAPNEMSQKLSKRWS